MTELYPDIEPFDRGMLDVGDGNRLYWEVCGNPSGKPAVVLHGGPGSGCTPGMRRYFDPYEYRVVLFDQRQSGRSTPDASDPATDLSSNTTHYLLADIERLREHLGIDRWLVYGGSWGVTLGLAYAQRFPERASEMVLVSVTQSRQEAIDWLYRGMGRFLPEEWERFRDGVPAVERDGDLVAAYHRLLESDDPAVREQAARDWCDWEEAAVSTTPGYRPNPRYESARFRMAFARIVTHYFTNGLWLEEGETLTNTHRLAGIPGVMIHGRLDLGAPLMTAWEMHGAWPGSELVIVGGAGHDTRDPGMAESIVAALDRFARRA